MTGRVSWIKLTICQFPKYISMGKAVNLLEKTAHIDFFNGSRLDRHPLRQLAFVLKKTSEFKDEQNTTSKDSAKICNRFC